MKLILNKPDSLGAFASTLCLIHCIATPFLFIAQTCSSTCCETAPSWWRLIDYLFLLVSFFAVYKSTQTTTSKIIKPILWISWSTLFFAILSESIHSIHLIELLKYIAGFSLIVVHIYNLKYCQCKNDKCCTNYE
ncbi:MerC mercury resistance protein [Lutibacter oricola]|uniref:MerC mercury resistance protein n=1 Tax=Lutibacter oricola TaxID=762486 RepID=A0A1H3EVC5_9FLAO|nr:MerC domain-containing protein [Lutibacter oricola]SDX82570.1 MerC mercury resistance protein [Lutibacter oricola]